MFIDSESVEAALVKGYSCREDMCEIMSVFWDLAFGLGVRVFVDSVSTDANPADWPSRDKLSIGGSSRMVDSRTEVAACAPCVLRAWVIYLFVSALKV